MPRHSMAGDPSYFLYIQTVLYIYQVSLMWKGSFSNAMYNFSYSSVFRRPDDASQLELKRVTVNKIDKNCFCVWLFLYIYLWNATERNHNTEDPSHTIFFF
jgi:hypothetical protein